MQHVRRQSRTQAEPQQSCDDFFAAPCLLRVFSEDQEDGSRSSPVIPIHGCLDSRHHAAPCNLVESVVGRSPIACLSCQRWRAFAQVLVTAALSTAGASTAAVYFVAVHGTGTPLGDPIEVGALGAALGTGRLEASKLLLGSSKVCRHA